MLLLRRSGLLREMREWILAYERLWDKNLLKWDFSDQVDNSVLGQLRRL